MVTVVTWRKTTCSCFIVGERHSFSKTENYIYSSAFLRLEPALKTSQVTSLQTYIHIFPYYRGGVDGGKESERARRPKSNDFKVL